MPRYDRLPNGQRVRCYDAGPRYVDRYTVLFEDLPVTYRDGTSGPPRPYDVRQGLAMSAHPSHPQGFGQSSRVRPRRPTAQARRTAVSRSRRYPPTHNAASSNTWRTDTMTDTLCGGCGHAAHWRECRGTTTGVISGEPIACECRRRGPSDESIMLVTQYRRRRAASRASDPARGGYEGD